MASRPSIFRKDALEHYQRKQEQDILPRYITPSVFACTWIFFCVLLLVGVFAWCGKVPTYLNGSGTILSPPVSSKITSSNNEAIVLFLPATDAPRVHPGEAVHIQVASMGTPFSSTIESVEPKILSPANVQQRFMPTSAVLNTINQPTIIAIVKPVTTLANANYTESVLTAQIQDGSQNIFSLLCNTTS
jgi:hypothetical protein